jgi:nitroreductase/catechol 2,3-dioxygenase-like lactoylglutathione lyase family enzyme
MNALVFYRSEILQEIVEFYTSRLGFSVRRWDGNSAILELCDFAMGFVSHPEPDTDSQITILLPDRQTLKDMHNALIDVAIAAPDTDGPEGQLHFFIGDPEGRLIEFVENSPALMPSPYKGFECLTGRRSIREYSPVPVPQKLLDTVLASVGDAPTSRNMPSTYVMVIQKSEIMQAISDFKGKTGSPITCAPLAVAILADPEITLRPADDAIIAAYHFMMAAHLNGLGTCYIGGLNAPEVKAILNVPESHFIATVTPLGYPARIPHRPEKPPMTGRIKFL